MRLIIISGRSGSGKSTALHQLEDEGFYCIDNLPVALLPALVTETSRTEFGQFRGTAVCIDARNAWSGLADFPAIIKSLPASIDSQVLFLDANKDTLIRRFSETRRRHPLSTEDRSLHEAIESAAPSTTSPPRPPIGPTTAIRRDDAITVPNARSSGPKKLPSAIRGSV